MKTLKDMYKRGVSAVILVSLAMVTISPATAQNPFIRDQFTADPSARVFNGKVYVYPSHDILANENRGRIGWFCMADYHVFSSEDLVNWIDHGVIVSQEKVDWVDSDSYSMWAPDCIERDGKYYFYFPSRPKGDGTQRGFGIGVAVSDSPEGPFVPEKEAIKGVLGIDPNIFIDKDGQAYLYWSMGKIFVAKLKDNMLELEGEPKVVADLPEKGLIEGPYLFEKEGLYYMTYPHVENKIERIEYAIGDNPMGPFTFAGVIMDESPTGCWTNHQSIIEYNGQWYFFYHHNDYSPKFDKSRSIRVDSLFFNSDGTIQQVKRTERGVGITSSSEILQIDRFSSMSNSGVTIELLDTLDTFRGWKTRMDSDGSWIQYNSVDFGDSKPKEVNVYASALNGAKLEIRTTGSEGTLLATVKIPASKGWRTIRSKVKRVEPGVQNLFFILKGDEPVEIDWVRFVE